MAYGRVTGSAKVSYRYLGSICVFIEKLSSNIGFTYYNDRLRKMRKVLQAPLSPTSVSKDWCGLLDSYSIQLCCAIRESKDVYNDVQARVAQL